MSNRDKKSKGSVLAYMLIVITISVVLLLSILQYVVSQIKNGTHSENREDAFQIAEAGMNFYKWYLAKEMETRTTPQDVLDYWANGDPIGTEHDCDEAGAYVREFDSGGVEGHYCLEVAPPDEWSTIFTVKSVGWSDKEPGMKRTVQARFRRPSFSEHMVVGNQQFNLNEETVAHGKLHSNEGISFNGTAYNIVSSEQETYHYLGWILGIGAGERPGVWTYWPGEYNDTLNEPVFQVGKQVGTAQGATHWDFPSVNSYIDFARTESQEGINPPEKADSCNPSGHTFCDSNGCYFTDCGEGQHIIFAGNTMTVCTVNSFCTSNFCWKGLNPWYYGKYSIKNYKKADGSSGTCDSCSGACASTYTIPTNGAIFVEDNAWVEGTLGDSTHHKKVTVVATNEADAEKSVLIGRNNLTYSSYDGDDILGLLGANNIEIIRYSQDNLRIDGALMAKSGRVGRDFYLLDIPNSITFFGSIISYGTFNVGKGIIPTWDVGYQHAYLNFDNNLLYSPPPFFPTGTGYSMDLWEEL